MALTVLKRPIGVILETGISATFATGGVDLLITTASAHGMADQDYVYVSCTVENYNGFWKIGLVNATQFRLYDENGITLLDFIANAIGTIYPQASTHGWSAVHLPITYKISNDLWPVNAVDSGRTITSLTNENGYARLGLSGSLGTFEDLSFVKISSASNSDLNGVYQIIDKISTSNVILNIAYSSINGAGILGATIQLYYSNYNTVIQVYAGINSSHIWTALKPYELAATLELIPDENNQVFFSINEILKAYVETKNNLLLASLPNNTDFWVNFYIKYAEQYDSSNGYTVGTTLTSYTSDLSTFEGTGVNDMLEFKNIQSGYLSDYLMTRSTAKFLTLFAIPVLFSCGEDTPNCYQDISFINPDDDSALYLQEEFYSNGVLSTTTYTSLGTYDNGVMRTELDPNCNYDRVDLTLIKIDTTGGWLSEPSAADNTWRSSAYGNGVFVAVGITGTGNRVMTSSDGKIWTIRTSAADNEWLGVTYGAGLFVAVARTGVGNRVMTSPDGITWTSRTSAADNEWESVIYGNGVFVAVSSTGVGNRVMTSPDGITWTIRTSAANNQWQSVAYGNGLFVSVSSDGAGNRVMTSPTGVTWTSRTSAANNSWESVTYGNGLFVAVSSTGTGNRVMTSPDGITWTLRTSAADISWNAIAYSNGIFIVTSTTGTGNRSMYSPDGFVWTILTTPVDNAWNNIATDGNGIFVSTSSTGTGDRAMTISIKDSETKQFTIECGCANQELRLTWLNNLGGFDYWVFNTEVDHAVDITGAGETKKNIFPEWPNSYGQEADTIRKQTFRESNKKIFFSTQNLDSDQAQAIAYIKSSVLVQVINSIHDKRTLIIDTDSFNVFTDNQKQITISFNGAYTDDIPGQRV